MNLIELKALQYDDMAAIQFIQKRMNDREEQIIQLLSTPTSEAPANEIV